ncbi:hypothetical protein EYF80_055623 [Liparis tanakae]|uniref:Uncharacterized protein n=1 Tax=Liparis tanakae TaxID=230148 RepID=A0A4Z2F018_9TELE|nr:hypothetical protein EYF80_055623 [Liparis tanakae]
MTLQHRGRTSQLGFFCGMSVFARWLTASDKETPAKEAEMTLVTLMTHSQDDCLIIKAQKTALSFFDPAAGVSAQLDPNVSPRCRVSAGETESGAPGCRRRSLSSDSPAASFLSAAWGGGAEEEEEEEEEEEGDGRWTAVQERPRKLDGRIRKASRAMFADT